MIIKLTRAARVPHEAGEIVEVSPDFANILFSQGAAVVMTDREENNTTNDTNDTGDTEDTATGDTEDTATGDTEDTATGDTEDTATGDTEDTATGDTPAPKAKKSKKKE